MLNRLMIATIEPKIQREWELNSASRKDIPTTAEIVTYMEARHRALERIHVTQSLKIYTANSLSSHKMEGKSVNLHIPT